VVVRAGPARPRQPAIRGRPATGDQQPGPCGLRPQTGTRPQTTFM